MTGIIYKAVNIVNGKGYIGQTKYDLETRWSEHCYAKGRNCRLLGRAIQKYGKDAFEVRELERIEDPVERDARERYWIEVLNTLAPAGYNLESGGLRHKNLAQETKDKIKAASTGFRCKQPNAKRITCMEIATGIERSYPNMGMAELDGFCRAAISQCRHGKDWSHLGFRWKNAEDVNYPEVKLSRIPKGLRLYTQKPTRSVHITKHKHCVPVIAQSLIDGNVLHFPSIKSAVQKGFDKSRIARCLAGHTVHHKGYSWRYA